MRASPSRLIMVVDVLILKKKHKKAPSESERERPNGATELDKLNQ
jgi:hypothetical protein